MTQPLTLAEATQHYLNCLQTQGKHARTLYTYGKDLQQIQAFFGPERLVQSLTLPLIGRFLKSDQLLKLPNGKERAPQTVQKTIRVFRMWMVWLRQEGHLADIALPKSIPMGQSKP